MKDIDIKFTSGKIERWNRQKLIEYIKNRCEANHYDDIADFFIFQINNYEDIPKSIKNVSNQIASSTDFQMRGKKIK